jgi:hypothetical protein
MKSFLPLYIYIISIIFTIFYDLFLSNGVNYLTYNKRVQGATVINISGAFIWGIFIFVANSYQYNTLAWALLIISIVSSTMVIICNILNVDLGLDYYMISPNNNQPNTQNENTKQN